MRWFASDRLERSSRFSASILPRWRMSQIAEIMAAEMTPIKTEKVTTSVVPNMLLPGSVA